MFAVSSKPLREVAVVTSPLRWEATFKQLEIYRYCDEPGSEIWVGHLVAEGLI